MNEKLYNEKINNFEENFFNKTSREFNDRSMPLKIKKNELLKSFDLPVPETSYFNSKDMQSLELEIIKKLKNKKKPLIARVACIPDKSSMPFFYVENKLDARASIDKLTELQNADPSITHFILQEVTSNENSKNKISGRIILENEKMMPTEEILEIYKGSRSTGILNNVDVKDKNYRRFEKRAGGFMKPVGAIPIDSEIKEGEVRDIYMCINDFKEKMETIKELIIKSRKSGDMPVCFEFSYTNGKFVFSDIDY